MVKGKIGGVILSGLAGYLLLSKTLGVIERSIKNICTASEWKNYYENSDPAEMVPPGYTIRTETNNSSEPAQKASGSPVAEAIVKAVSDTFFKGKEENEASEGQTEASEEADTPSAEEEAESKETLDTDVVEARPESLDGIDILVD